MQENELTIRRTSLPTLSDMEVKDGVDKIGAYINALSASKKATNEQSIIDEIDEQIRTYSALLLRYRMELGRRTEAFETNRSFHGNQYSGESRGSALTKKEMLAELGTSHQRASENERLCASADIVEQYIAESEERNEAPTVAGALRAIKGNSRPHVVNNSGENEWYTPSRYIEAAREAMGSIDLDPASSDMANEVVKAARYCTAETDGLSYEWGGNIWMNPPYSSDLVGRFISKLVDERDNYEQAVVLVNNATETEWFRRLISIASAVCFPYGRIRYYSPNGKNNSPLQGQAIVYVGGDVESFFDAFSEIGWRCSIVDL